MAARLFKALEQSRKVSISGPSASDAVTSIAAAAAPLMHLALSSRQRQTPGYTTDTLSSPATMSSQSEELSVPFPPSSSATLAPGGRSGEGDKGDRMDLKPLLQEWYGRSFASALGAPSGAAAGGGGSPPPGWRVGQERGGGAGGFPAQCFVPGGRGRASAAAVLQFLEELSKTASKATLAKPELNHDQDEDQNRNQQQLLVCQGLPFAVSNPPWLPPATSSDSFESPLGSALVTPRKVLGAPQMDPCYGAEGSPGAEGHCSFPGAPVANKQPPSLGRGSYHGSPSGFPLDESNAEDEQEAHHQLYFQKADVVYQKIVPGSGDVHEPLSEKKLRRLLSNRASAKRSRKRRQERLEELEIVTARLRVEQAETQHSLATARAEVRKLRDQNEELKKEINRLQVAGGTPRATAGTLEDFETRSKIGSKKHSCCLPDAPLEESLKEETETPKHFGGEIEMDDAVPPKKRSKPESSLHVHAEPPKPLVQPDNRSQKVCDLKEFLVYIGCEEMVHAC